MSLYVYCLADEVDLKMIDSRGVEEAPVRLIEAHGLKAVVSDYKEAMVLLNRDNVLAHERVVASVLATTTPLPFRFGTLIDQDRLDSYIESNQDKLVFGLARVRGSVEMSVKILLGEARTAKKTPEMEDPRTAELGPGGRFLLQKRRELEEDEAMNKRTKEIAEWLGAIVNGYVRESVVRLRPGGSIALAASFLVERFRIEEYRRRVASGLGEQNVLRFLTSGPWPPYSFCDLSG